MFNFLIIPRWLTVDQALQRITWLNTIIALHRNASGKPGKLIKQSGHKRITATFYKNNVE
ncbi:hypothetical protein [Dyadobacter sp. LHD-138]|uniref:hypothetical protein n=1 Tax=Dyadobacter sp. LHD-138 TaxID=3071413 RepID=UPI0027DF3A6A|nr:hypothetical protein [Dyadobacter sp. LHD-138]MDQ6482067.1 hypothetical protein [Dyadobacter sp. LHD-138]